MQLETINWEKWRKFFASRKDRQLPQLEDPSEYRNVPNSVARSLAIFQLGESGGGSVVEQARRSEIRSINGDYADAMAMFVAEEHRHAEILAICVRNLGGSLIRKNWTAGLFVFGRRMIGLRLKILVLLAAEVVGICYYHLLASRLPDSRIKSLLMQMVSDEQAHLHFHCEFLRSQTRGFFRRQIFKATWRFVMFVAALVVACDHRTAILETRIGIGNICRRWVKYSQLAEQLIVDSSSARSINLMPPLDLGSNTHASEPDYVATEVAVSN